MSGTVYVIGAGLAGLSAATILVAKGRKVEVFEAAPHAGGRCRSYFDPSFDAVIDNGNHLVLSGNRAVNAYLARMGAAGNLTGPERTEIAFVDMAGGERWTVRPNNGPLPWWVLWAEHRVPGTVARDYLDFWRLMQAKKTARVADEIGCAGTLWDRLTEPFLLAALNTKPQEGSALLAGNVVRETLAKGAKAYRPRIATHLGAAFVDPALAYLEKHGGKVRFGARVKALTIEGGRITGFTANEGDILLAKDDGVILAVPPWVAKDLLPELTVPDDFRAIVNAHFKLPAPKGVPPMIGVVGGTAEWIFAFADRISVTVSAADRLVDEDREKLARIIWADVARVHGLPEELPVWQIVKEKRATFAATPEQNKKRPQSDTRFANLHLAGDWTDTGLPATIEGALRSGEKAAKLALAR